MKALTHVILMTISDVIVEVINIYYWLKTLISDGLLLFSGSSTLYSGCIYVYWCHVCFIKCFD